MVHAHVERDDEGIHVNYYDTDHHKEGYMELNLVNPKDITAIHEEDHVELVGMEESTPEKPITLHVVHPDGTCDDIPCKHS